MALLLVGCPGDDDDDDAPERGWTHANTTVSINVPDWLPGLPDEIDVLSFDCRFSDPVNLLFQNATDDKVRLALSGHSSTHGTWGTAVESGIKEVADSVFGVQLAVQDLLTDGQCGFANTSEMATNGATGFFSRRFHIRLWDQGDGTVQGAAHSDEFKWIMHVSHDYELAETEITDVLETVQGVTVERDEIDLRNAIARPENDGFQTIITLPMAP